MTTCKLGMLYAESISGWVRFEKLVRIKGNRVLCVPFTADVLPRRLLRRLQAPQVYNAPGAGPRIIEDIC